MIDRVNKLYRFFIIYTNVRFLVDIFPTNDDIHFGPYDVKDDKYGEKHLLYFLQTTSSVFMDLIYEVLRSMDEDKELDYESKRQMIRSFCYKEDLILDFFWNEEFI